MTKKTDTTNQESRTVSKESILNADELNVTDKGPFYGMDKLDRADALFREERNNARGRGDTSIVTALDSLNYPSKGDPVGKADLKGVRQFDRTDISLPFLRETRPIFNRGDNQSSRMAYVSRSVVSDGWDDKDETVVGRTIEEVGRGLVTPNMGIVVEDTPGTIARGLEAAEKINFIEDTSGGGFAGYSKPVQNFGQLIKRAVNNPFPTDIRLLYIVQDESINGWLIPTSYEETIEPNLPLMKAFVLVKSEPERFAMMVESLKAGTPCGIFDYRFDVVNGKINIYSDVRHQQVLVYANDSIMTAWIVLYNASRLSGLPMGSLTINFSDILINRDIDELSPALWNVNHFLCPDMNDFEYKELLKDSAWDLSKFMTIG